MSGKVDLPFEKALVEGSVKDKIKALEMIRVDQKKEYLPLLKQRLVEEEGVTTTVALIETVVEIDEKEAAAKCALRLWDSHPEIRAAAIAGIGKKGTESNVNVLTRFLEDESKKVKEQAEYWLRKRGILKSSRRLALKTIAVFIFIAALVLEGLCFHLNLFALVKSPNENVSLLQIAAEALCHKRLNGKEAFQYYKSKSNMSSLHSSPELLERFQALSAKYSSANLSCDDFTLEPVVKKLMEDNEYEKAFAIVLQHPKLAASERLALDIIVQHERNSPQKADELFTKAAEKGMLTELAAARKLLEK